MTLLPALRLGIVVLTNQESEGAVDAVTLHVLDAYLRAPASDWLSAFAAADERKRVETEAAIAARDRARHPELSPSLPLTAYTGDYHDPWYGAVAIEPSAAALRLRFTRSKGLVGTLSHWEKDTFLVRWDDRTLNADAFIDFQPDDKRNVRSATMRRASPRVARAFDYEDLRLTRVTSTRALPHGVKSY